MKPASLIKSPQGKRPIGRLPTWVLMLILTLLLVTGCATDVPRQISSAPDPDLSLEQVQSQQLSEAQEPVRWGGRIIQVINLSEGSEVILLGKPLNNWGQPWLSHDPQGRFIARFAQFIDPAEFADGRGLTISGKLVGREKREVGEFEYEYPVVDVSSHYLWPIKDKWIGSDYWWRHDSWMHRDRSVIIVHPKPAPMPH